MPKKTLKITVCSNCGCKTCDGAIWKMINVLRYKTGIVEDEKYIDENIPKENITDCTLRWFKRGEKEFFVGKKVGDVVTKRFDNWSIPSDVTLRKIKK